MKGRHGFTPELLDDLHDLVRKFGHVSAATHSVSLAVLAPRQLVAAVPIGTGDRRLVVCGRHRDLEPERVRVVLLTPDGVENAAIAGDVAPVDLRGMIARVDGVMRGHGGFEADGRRKRVPYDLSARFFRRSVDAVFGASGAWEDEHQLIPIPRSAPPELVEAVRELFDRPEDLADVTDYFGFIYVCHRRHKAELDEANAVMSALCARLGVTTEEQLALTPRAVLDRTYRELLAERGKNRPN